MAARRPRRQSTHGAPPVEVNERALAHLYREVLLRYQYLTAIEAVTLMAVRLFVKRVGFDRMLNVLVTYGTAVVAERCRHELTLRQEFMAHMLAKYPPENPVEGQEAIEEMAEDLAVIDCPEGAMRLLRFLDRVRNREILMRAKAGTVH
jgi:hypothetical protein